MIQEMVYLKYQFEKKILSITSNKNFWHIFVTINPINNINNKIIILFLSKNTIQIISSNNLH